MRHALMEMLLGNKRPAALRPGGGGGPGPSSGGGGGSGGPGPSGGGSEHVRTAEQRGRARPRGGGKRGAAQEAVPARRLRLAGVWFDILAGEHNAVCGSRPQQQFGSGNESAAQLDARFGGGKESAAQLERRAGTQFAPGNQVSWRHSLRPRYSGKVKHSCGWTITITGATGQDSGIVGVRCPGCGTGGTFSVAKHGLVLDDRPLQQLKAAAKAVEAEEREALALFKRRRDGTGSASGGGGASCSGGSDKAAATDNPRPPALFKRRRDGTGSAIGGAGKAAAAAGDQQDPGMEQTIAASLETAAQEELQRRRRHYPGADSIVTEHISLLSDDESE